MYLLQRLITAVRATRSSLKPAIGIKSGTKSIGMIKYVKARGTRPFKYHLDLEIINKLTPETWKNKIF